MATESTNAVRPAMLCGPHTHDTRPRNRRHKSTPFLRSRFLLRVSCKSGTGFVRYQILAPIRTLFYSKPVSVVHVTEILVHDLFLFNFLLATKPGIMIMASGQLATSANSSSTSLSATLIYCARNFHFRTVRRPTGARKWSRYMALVSEACVIGLVVTLSSSWWRTPSRALPY